MKFLFIIFLSFLVSSCAPHSFVKTGTAGPFTTKPENCQVDIYTSPNLPDRTMTEIGICFAKAPGGGVISDNTPEAVNQLKKCVCQNGGDAIVLNPIGESGVLTRAGYSQQAVQVSGKVYRYK